MSDAVRFMNTQNAKYANQLLAVLESIQRELPQLAEQEGLVTLKERVDEFAQRAQQETLTLGIFGPPGSRKAQLLAMVLNVDEAANPTISDRTTCTIARIKASDPDYPLWVEARHMDADQFQGRVAAMCSMLNIEYSQDSRALLEAVQQRLEAKDAQQEELGYLAALLFSHRDHAAKLGEPLHRPRQNDCPKYLSPQAHPESSFPLLADIEIFFPTSELPAQFELIEFPDLRVSDREDDLLTGGYLEKLDAAIVLLDWKALSGRQVDDLFNRLRTHCGQIGDRLWLAVTGFEEVEADQLAPGGETPTVWDHLLETLARVAVGHGQLLLLGHPPGQTAVPASLKASVAISQAYQEFAFDGGKQSVQRLVTQNVLNRVEQELEQHLEKQRSIIRNEISALVENGRDGSIMSREAREVVVSWAVELGDLRRWLRRHRRDVFEAPANALEEDLEGYLDYLLRAADDEAADDEAADDDDYRFICGALQSRAFDEVTRTNPTPQKRACGTMKSTYDAVDEAIRCTKPPPIQIGAGDEATTLDPRAEWESHRKRDLEHHEWATDIFNALSRDVPAGLEMDTYVALIRKKIRYLVHDYAILVRITIEDHINRLGKQIRLLSTDGETSNPRNAEVYDKILEQLRSVDEEAPA